MSQHCLKRRGSALPAHAKKNEINKKKMKGKKRGKSARSCACVVRPVALLQCALTNQRKRFYARASMLALLCGYTCSCVALLQWALTTPYSTYKNYVALLQCALTKPYSTNKNYVALLQHRTKPVALLQHRTKACHSTNKTVYHLSR